MKTLWSAVILIQLLSVNAHAQTSATKKNPTPTTTVSTAAPASAATPTPTPAPAKPKRSGIAPDGTQLPRTNPVAVTPAAPAPAPNPWKILYEGEYVGPRLSNIKIDETQGPDDPLNNPTYSEWTHRLKIGHTLFSDDFVVGWDQFATQPFNPELRFVFADVRLYMTLSHMIQNDIIDIKQTVDFQLPTSDASQLANMTLRLNFKTLFVFQGLPKNWGFNFLTYLSPRFYSQPSAEKPQTDFVGAIYPTLTYDFSPMWTFQFEGGFDSSHKVVYEDLDFNAGDADYFDTGFVFNGIPHVSLYPALRTYTGNVSIKSSVLYLLVDVSL